jgi:hypothetical protein
VAIPVITININWAVKEEDAPLHTLIGGMDGIKRSCTIGWSIATALPEIVTLICWETSKCSTAGAKL